jgi:hypothetical protein
VHSRRPVGTLDAGDISSPRLAKLMHCAFTRTSTPSRSTISRIVVETSSSSRPTSRGPISMTVTSAPKRRNI